MNMHARKETQGTIGISVLALFAVAIIAGQARGDLDRTLIDDAELPTAIDLGVLVEDSMPTSVTIGREAMRKFTVTPVAIDFGVDVFSLSGTETDESATRRTAF